MSHFPAPIKQRYIQGRAAPLSLPVSPGTGICPQISHPRPLLRPLLTVSLGTAQAHLSLLFLPHTSSPVLAAATPAGLRANLCRDVGQTQMGVGLRICGQCQVEDVTRSGAESQTSRTQYSCLDWIRQ